MRVLILFVFLIGCAAILTLSGCNAVKGAGTDISEMSQHTQDWMEGR